MNTMEPVLKELFSALSRVLDITQSVLSRLPIELEPVNSKLIDNPVFYRYIRPIDPRTATANSQKGITLRFELDYTNRQIVFSYAICNQKTGESSFSKEVGKKIATHADKIIVPLWDATAPLEDSNITSYVLDYVSDHNLVPDRHMQHIAQQYMEQYCYD
jgi:hypothetical protein